MATACIQKRKLTAVSQHSCDDGSGSCGGGSGYGSRGVVVVGVIFVLRRLILLYDYY